MPTTPGPVDVEHRVRLALVRDVPDSYHRCLKRPGFNERIDVTLARAQHKQYVRALRQADAQVVVLRADDPLPDAPFIEDTAVILPRRQVVLARSAVFARSGEAAGVRSHLQECGVVHGMPAGMTLDGGDVLRIGDDLYVGLSERSSRGGLDFLASVAHEVGMTVRPVPVEGALHLKSCCTYLGRGLVLHAAGMVRPDTFPGMELVVAPEAEGANVLPVNGQVIVPAEAPGTCRALTRLGFHVTPVPLSEFIKGNGGPTCLSLRID